MLTVVDTCIEQPDLFSKFFKFTKLYETRLLADQINIGLHT